METMHMLPTIGSTDLTTLPDTAIEGFFAEFGLDVEVIDHCPDASCPICFSPAPAKAA